MAVAGAGHPMAMESARRAADAGLIEPVLVGDVGDIGIIAKNMDWDISAYRLVPVDDEDTACEVAVALARRQAVSYTHLTLPTILLV